VLNEEQRQILAMLQQSEQSYAKLEDCANSFDMGSEDLLLQLADADSDRMEFLRSVAKFSDLDLARLKCSLTLCNWFVCVVKGRRLFHEILSENQQRE